MGVMATYCQICGIPVQQDHYVELENMLGIYRGGEGPEVCAPAFEFGREHAWLKDAVALRLDKGQTPVVIEGRVHDGGIDSADGVDYDDGLLFEGLEERAALHRACWELAGRPDSWEALAHVRAPETAEEFKEQLFEFAAFAESGHAWMLCDPRSETPDGVRNRAHILGVLQADPGR